MLCCGCAAQESPRTCAELGWDPHAQGLDPNVCGESNFVGAEGADAAGCVTFVDFPSALKTCVNAGGRLCTAAELLEDAGHGTVSRHDIAEDLGCILLKIANNNRHDYC